MNFSRPFLTITPTVDGDVLEALASADAWFTASRLSSVIDRWSLDGVRKALNRLADQGIVETERAGAAVLYRLNRQHLAAEAIIYLANMRHELVARLAALMSGWTVRPDYAAVFGSATGRTMRSDSDIDIFLLRPLGQRSDGWLDQISRLQIEAGRMTGNDVRVLDMDEIEVSSNVTPGRSVVDDVLDVGLTICGDRDWLARQRSAA